MSDYKIEKGIPIPTGRKGRPRYPFGEMEIGDCVFIPCKEGERTQDQSMKLSGSLTYHRPKKFTRRQEPGGVRVWRTK